MSLLSDLEIQYKFSDSEKEIANYILSHKKEILKMKITDLADITYTSASTISRLCRKLHMDSYNNFKLELAHLIDLKDISSYANVNYPFRYNDSNEQVCENMELLYKETIESTQDLIDFEILKGVIDLIDKGEELDIYAIGHSYISALMFEHKLAYINKHANLKTVPTEQDQIARFTNENTVALFISYSGDSPNVKKIVDRVKSRKGKIIAITSISDSYLRENSDYILTMCSKENFADKISVFSSQLSSNYILDLIYSLLYKKHYFDYIQLRNKHFI
ncbi:MAG: MurR/RpiR family transcriptional regulator [Coprobacillus sp.]